LQAPKPHLPFDQQLERFRSRGLTYDSYSAAMAALKRIGYYRFSGYAYPFRSPLEAIEMGKLRSEVFVPGARFEDAVKLYNFDEKLRLVLLEGLNAIEVGLAVRVGYALGKRDPLAHFDPSNLDPKRCLERDPARNTGLSAYEAWRRRHDKLRESAAQEEYVKHHIMKYDGDVPIWAATEYMDFGCLVRLYYLMQDEDRRAIAAVLGVTNDRADLLYRWLLALNILRNHCAHNNRVWNRSTVAVPPKFGTSMVANDLQHLNNIDAAEKLKIYYVAAIIAYLIRQIDPQSTWSLRFRTQVRKLGNVGGMTIENTMGFPEHWETLALWRPAA
jgi:abortive infection bacteriophage resistance protein